MTRRRGGRRWGRSGGLLALVLAACGSEGTGILIEVTSPLAVPAEVDQLRIEVRGEESGEMLDRRLPLASSFPHSVAILAGPSRNESIVVTVTGEKQPADFVIRRVVRSAFRSGQTVVLPIDLPRECLDVRCPDGVDCVAGLCATPPPDGGVDAGSDAAPDAVVDGGADAGPECVTDPDCDDAVGCTIDWCVGGSCTHRPVDSVCEGGCDEVTGCTPRSCGAPGDCDDGDDCSGMELCAAGRCAVGPHEPCPGATVVGGEGGRFTVALGGASESGSCGGDGAEATLAFTVRQPSDAFITTHASGVDTVVYVRSCACDGEEVGCNDDADGLPSSRLQLTDLAPGTYNVFVDSDAAMSGMVDVDVYVSPAGIEGDRCGHPEPIATGTARLEGDTCSFTADYALGPRLTGCEFDGAGVAEERVYFFRVPDAVDVIIDGCLPENVMDTVLYVRDVCTAISDPPLACNDDGCPGDMACGMAYRSRLTTPLPPGLYYLFVDGYSQADWPCPCGDYAVTLSGI